MDTLGTNLDTLITCLTERFSVYSLQHLLGMSWKKIIILLLFLAFYYYFCLSNFVLLTLYYSFSAI